MIKIKPTLPLSLVCTALSWSRLEDGASTMLLEENVLVFFPSLRPRFNRSAADPKLLGDEVSGLLANYGAGYPSGLFS
ncbi:hypothetical protein B0H14DRAFT_2674546 [Mycena olivaceomarginata]|nr:hypothetical protein B0H14DRAFT_2712453 [Mycena olivaceomarginata]KAJ7898900.1 hypothetical protein B0H14DRAFT_2674546 [Mycena olivaceomarginata]